MQKTIYANGSAEVLIPKGQKIAIATYGNDYATISFKRGNNLEFVQRLDNDQVVLGSYADNRTVVISAASDAVFYSVAEAPFITDGRSAQFSADGKSLAGVDGLGASVYLLPSGGDDTQLVEDWVNSQAIAGQPALFGPGNFIITGPMVWRSGKVLDKWGNKGIGLIAKGSGPGNTNFYYSGPSGSPMITVNSPTSAGIGNRNYLTNIEGMSWLRATSGTNQIAQGTTSGSAFYGVPSAQYEVFHTPRFKDLFIDGFDYHITLSDCTLPDFDTVWFNEFLSAVRSGYNQDIVKFHHCMFGSEQFGSTYRNSAKAFEGGFNDGIWTAGNENIVEFEHCWFMKIGVAAWFPNAQDVKGVRFNRAYFEDVRQYFVHDGVSSNWSAVSFNECHFSKPTTNDVIQTDPTQAGYMAKIQFGGDVATGAGKTAYLTIQDCTADILQPANAWVSFVNLNSQVNWFNNASLAPSASFGHIRCTRTAKAAFRAFPAIGGLYPGSYVLGDQSGAGLTHQGGSNIEVAATIGVGATYNISHLSGTHFYLTLPDGDCTIQIDAASAGYYATAQSKAKVILIAPASVGATRTITFGSRVIGAGATLTYTTTDNNKRAMLMLEGTGKGDVSMRCVNGTPSFT